MTYMRYDIYTYIKSIFSFKNLFFSFLEICFPFLIHCWPIRARECDTTKITQTIEKSVISPILQEIIIIFLHFFN